MKRFQSVAPALLMSLAIAAAPAFAGQHSRSGGGSGGRAVQSSGGRAVGQAAPRGATRAAQAVPRTTPRIAGPGGFVGAPYYGFYRPYYTFRPRLSLGFGLWLGYPVGYPYYYPYYPYAYPYPYPYPYPDPNYPDYSYPAPAPSGSAPSGSVSVAPPTGSGGLSFDITPSNAEVFVDGQRVGTVADFSPTMPPLALAPGRHSVDIRANGYQTMVFDADVTAGQVLPYHGAMRSE